MIRCLSLNPCMDKTVVCPSFSPEKTNRVKPLRSDLGGKGVNVARVLHTLGAPVCLYAFDFSGSPVKRALSQEGIPHMLREREGFLRVNLKILNEETNAIIEINEAGAETDGQDLQSLLSSFLSDCRPGDIGVLSGSLAPGIDSGIYRDLCEKLHEKGCYAAVDCDGEALALALEKKPDLIKPNREEFARLTGVENGVDFPGALQIMHRDDQADTVCLSLGRDGALLSRAGSLWHCPAADVPVSSATGAGDSMLAGLLCAFDRGMNAEEALCFASAAAGASVMRPGTLLCQREDVLSLLPSLQAVPVPLP